ncbi:hypothetical protein QAD02_001778 [Eretmocerus hayati]|uniref:Uncharacterized protein n=1 Tax=Eretmocerus hayati TaxID=131215 RepID=A0ACC2NJM3_9HYME|nr:hypothetical protein QAD02_001778 [Eretmocerus hayati]
MTKIIVGEAVLNYGVEKYDFDHTADLYDWSKHPCRRNCWSNKEPKTCYYVFVLEQFSSMSKACYNCPLNMSDCYRPHCMPVDGVQKLLYVVNRQIPGPPIEVCRNDTIVVDVRNNMLAESTTIHWHGIKQIGTPYMDGVPYVNQCPIPPGERFRYIFNADLDGTYFWHSHIGNQRADGLYGALIIHPSIYDDKHKELYDHDDHHMIVGDWSHLDGNSAAVKEYYDRLITPDTLVVNGRGRFQRFNDSNQSDVYTPVSVFTVKKSQRYRFRVINAGVEDCPIQISIDGHSLLIISLDSQDIVPVRVDVINIWAGERIDFILNANASAGNYWIRLRGFGLCSASNTSTGAFQVARLRYTSAPNQDPSSPVGYGIPNLTSRNRVFNPVQGQGLATPAISINIPQLVSMAPSDISLQPVPHQQIYISFDFYPLDNYDYHRKNLYGYNQVPPARRIGSLQLNHISLKLPSFPLLSQTNMIGPRTLCNSSTIPRDYCVREQCACTHVLQVELNSVVELVFVDEGRYAVINHPLHLHGHFFRVVASEELRAPITVAQVQQLDRQGRIHRNLNRAPLKDTMKVPQGGYTIVRFYANNPGYWFFHCHFEQHNNNGMALIFKIGEHSDFPPVPENFPKCGNYESPRF